MIYKKVNYWEPILLRKVASYKLKASLLPKNAFDFLIMKILSLYSDKEDKVCPLVTFLPQFKKF